MFLQIHQLSVFEFHCVLVVYSYNLGLSVEAMGNEGATASEQHRNDKQTTVPHSRSFSLNANRHSRMKQQKLNISTCFNIQFIRILGTKNPSLPTPHLQMEPQRCLMGKFLEVSSFHRRFLLSTPEICTNIYIM